MLPYKCEINLKAIYGRVLFLSIRYFYCEREILKIEYFYYSFFWKLILFLQSNIQKSEKPQIAYLLDFYAFSPFLDLSQKS